MTELVTLGAQGVVPELLEQDVTAFWGREHDQRGRAAFVAVAMGTGSSASPRRRGDSGARPLVRHTTEPCESRLLTFLAGHRMGSNGWQPQCRPGAYPRGTSKRRLPMRRGLACSRTLR